MFKVVSNTDHHEPVKLVVFEWQFINVTGASFDFVAVDFFGLFEFRFGIIKNDDFVGTL